MGGEYRVLSKELDRLGVQHRITCPYTSEQNGVAERKHMQLVDMGLSLLAQSDIPLKFWFYAFAHAVYLTIRLPTPVLNHSSPYEVLYQVTPDYGLLRVFGCTCFPDLRPFQQHKLNFRSQRCVFLSGVPNTKGYRCLATDGRIFLSHHVRFDETTFPFNDGFYIQSSVDSMKGLHQCSVLPLVATNNSCGHILETPRSRRVSRMEPSPGQSQTTQSSSNIPTDLLTVVEVPIVDQIKGDATAPSAPVRANTYPMQTHSKSGVFRPKVFASVSDETEPTNIAEAF